LLSLLVGGNITVKVFACVVSNVVATIWARGVALAEMLMSLAVPARSFAVDGIMVSHRPSV